MSIAPTTYAIRVEGHLDGHWSARLGGLDMTRGDDGAIKISSSNHHAEMPRTASGVVGSSCHDQTFMSSPGGMRPCRSTPRS